MSAEVKILIDLYLREGKLVRGREGRLRGLQGRRLFPGLRELVEKKGIIITGHRGWMGGGGAGKLGMWLVVLRGREGEPGGRTWDGIGVGRRERGNTKKWDSKSRRESKVGE